jgi:peptidoglycan/LPS O-acetylase OafA/YrhL
MSSTNAQRLQVLDALRGIAALAVVLFHFTLHHEGYERVFRFGTTGVDLFFIISGFVIFMSLQKVSSVKEFIINRFCRLYPAYWMGVLFSFTVISIHFYFSPKYPIHEPVQTLLANLTMFQYYLGYSDLEGPYWTMNVEMLFYIFMAILFGLKALKHTRWMGAGICVILGAAAFSVDQIGWIKEVFMKIPLLYHFPLFFAGIVYYSLYKRELSQRAGLGFLALAFMAQMALFPHTWRACKHMTQPEYFVVLALFFSAFFAFTSGRLQFICNGITLFLGKISYPLYLTHQFLSINLIIPYLMWKHEMTLPAAALGVALPTSILVATIIHYLGEKTASNWLKQKLSAIFLNPVKGQ